MTDVLTLAREGVSDREIERRTGISRKVVARLRREHDIPAWVAPPPEHGTSARWQRGCRCDPCVLARRAQKRASYEREGPAAERTITPARSAKLAERSRQIQAATRAAAGRSRDRWTEGDLAVALDYRHTARQAAAILGRSLSAVRHVRVRYRARPEMLPHRPRQ